MSGRVVVEDGAIVHEEGGRSDVPWWGVTKTAITAATLPGVPPGPVWQRVGYGLGIVVARGTAGFDFTGRNGGGPGSFLAVYRSRGRTAAAFARNADQTTVEQSCLAMLM